jgi:hypothetical protein
MTEPFETEELFEAMQETAFSGHQLDRFATIYTWASDDTTRLFALKEMLRHSEKINGAAAIVRRALDKAGEL